MKKWITSAAILAAAFFPQAAQAAEEAGAERGSWLLLTFFAINFVLFVGVLVYFAGAAARMAALEAELKQLADAIENETAFQIGKVADLAKATADRIHRDAEMSSSALSEAAKRSVRAQLADSAATLARDLIGRDFQRNDQGRLIDGFTDKLGQGDRQ